MKQFRIQHLFFDSDTGIYPENELPEWLMHKDFKWWLDDYVLKLEVNQFIESDFHRITRIK